MIDIKFFKQNNIEINKDINILNDMDKVIYEYIVENRTPPSALMLSAEDFLNFKYAMKERLRIAYNEKGQFIYKDCLILIGPFAGITPLDHELRRQYLKSLYERRKTEEEGK